MLREMNRAAHGFAKASVKVAMVVTTCDPSPWERKAVRSGVLSPWLPSEFKVNLDYRRFCSHKEKENKNHQHGFRKLEQNKAHLKERRTKYRQVRNTDILICVTKIPPANVESPLPGLCFWGHRTLIFYSPLL